MPIPPAIQDPTKSPIFHDSKKKMSSGDVLTYCGAVIKITRAEAAAKSNCAPCAHKKRMETIHG